MERRISARRTFGRRLGITAVIAALVAAPMSLSSATAEPEGPDLWTPSDVSSRTDRDLRVEPTDFEAYTLDHAAMAELLDDAPREGTRGAETTDRVISVPAPTGELVEFEVTESPVMQSGLAANHPEIRTYAGHAVEDPSATIRLDLTPTGFHASVRGDASQGAWYVDPAYNDDRSRYLSYLGSDLPKPDDGFSETDVEGIAKRLRPDNRRTSDDDVELRTYRLALVNDPAYARYFGTENVLAEKATLINRVNHVYNDDLAIRLLLVNGSEKLNLDTRAKAVKPNGPCGSRRCFAPAQLEACSSETLDRNSVVLGQLIGARKYDVGHVALGVSGGGIAGLGVVGGPHKAAGCTGLPTPEGDYYAVDYVAHEVGHQFGGNHTFNGTNGACSGANRAAGASVEPGSGSSVMAYAGICDNDNLQPHSDPYFSQRSIQEVGTYVASKQPRLNEMQTVSLRNFNKREDAFRLRTGHGVTRKIRYGKNYTRAKIDKALERELGENTVEVVGWGGVTEFGDAGFSVKFNGRRAHSNQKPLSVVGEHGDVGGFVGETRHGGPSGNTGDVVPTGNEAPEVEAPANKRIPIRTPFTLEASATDDGHGLTYSWEQNDRGGEQGTGLLNQTKRAGPLFRIFSERANVTPAGTLQYNSPGQNHTSGDPARTFPDMEQVLAGNTNAATGKCDKGAEPIPRTECFAEWLPTRDYTGRKERALHFRVTARDHNASAGGTAYGDVTLEIARKAGPFLVTSQSEPGTAVRGTRTQPVEWAVNGTDKGSLAKRVRITLSTDGGETFDTVLKRNTRNDGGAYVTWPNIDTEHARIKIEAVGNYFFAVNAADFTIVPVQ